MRKPRHQRAGRLLTSVAFGAGMAAALAAIAASIAMSAVRSQQDIMSRSPSAIGVLAAVTGVCVLAVAASRWLKRYAVARAVGYAAGIAAIGLGAWNARGLVELQGSSAWLPFMDSTGATVISAAAMMAATAAAALGVIAAPWFASVDHRTALCAFLVVVVGAPILTCRAVENYRATVWHPEFTTEAAPAAPVPEVVGPIGYRIPLGSAYFATRIVAAGNGFIVDTRDQLTAYDGATGEKRWQVGHYGTSGRLFVVHRNLDDTSGIVVLFQAYGLIAFDGSSGEVLWRREYSDGGHVTAATGSIDALGMAVFTADSVGEGPDSTRTRLYSLDPATGQVRWAGPIPCSNPTLSPGVAGQFAVDCMKPVIMDARTGNTIEVPGIWAPKAGTDAYVVDEPQPHFDPEPTDVTRVLDRAGKVIDEIPGSYPASTPHDGLLLLRGSGGTWLLRDYRTHRSTVVPIDPNSRPADVDAVWLTNKLLIPNRISQEQQFQLVDLTHPADEPVIIDSPCPRGQYQFIIEAVAGAVIVQCRLSEVIGLVPDRR